ncbi:hypothetical protein NITHO_4260002 [Nitrolancea hollandica Lb]|uniref:Uncharacterized protein n=1 Tax=Nitrolancea hollandica Lb TaxID=1129897 RepID=I4EJW2_9BACT|nr:hypothetical protein NITHO_4260002 [Nitrolancea hollandica Lb]
MTRPFTIQRVKGASGHSSGIHMAKRVIDSVGTARYPVAGGNPRPNNGGDDAAMVNWAPHRR